jgi:hypothetical protein
MIRRQDVLAGALAVLGLGATVLGALMPRLTGTVSIGLSGFKLEVAKLSEVGRLAGYSDEEILAAIEGRLGEETRLQIEQQLQDRRGGSVQVGSGGIARPPLAWRDSIPAHDDEEIQRTYKAITDLDHASPERPALLIQLGTLLIHSARHLGHEQDADYGVAILREALELIPQSSPAYIEALTQLTAALEILYPPPRLARSQGDILFLLEQLEQARRRRRKRRRLRWSG